MGSALRETGEEGESQSIPAHGAHKSELRGGSIRQAVCHFLLRRWGPLLGYFEWLTLLAES